jgi:hypothetical protein
VRKLPQKLRLCGHMNAARSSVRLKNPSAARLYGFDPRRPHHHIFNGLAKSRDPSRLILLRTIFSGLVASWVWFRDP